MKGIALLMLAVLAALLDSTWCQEYTTEAHFSQYMPGNQPSGGSSNNPAYDPNNPGQQPKSSSTDHGHDDHPEPHPTSGHPQDKDEDLRASGQTQGKGKGTTHPEQSNDNAGCHLVAAPATFISVIALKLLL